MSGFSILKLDNCDGVDLEMNGLRANIESKDPNAGQNLFNMQRTKNVKIKADDAQINIVDPDSKKKNDPPPQGNTSRNNPYVPRRQRTRLRIRFEDRVMDIEDINVDTTIGEVIDLVKQKHPNPDGEWQLVHEGFQKRKNITLDQAGIYNAVVDVVKIS